MNGLQGRVALVTGAGGGIGRAIAIRLANEGMKVGVNDVNEAGVLDTVKLIEAQGGDAIGLPGDVSREDDARQMVEACSDTLGGLFTLINNAGVDLNSSLATTTRHDWTRVHDVDLWGTFLMVHEAEPLLAQERGSVVNIASTHAIATVPERSAYAAAKAGVVGLTRALAVELGPNGVRVNGIMPGYIETPIWKMWLDESPDPSGLLKSIAARHPLRRLGRPEDVAGAAAFLVSDDASFVSGTCIVVDGAYTTQLEQPNT